MCVGGNKHGSWNHGTRFRPRRAGSKRAIPFIVLAKTKKAICTVQVTNPPVG